MTGAPRLASEWHVLSGWGESTRGVARVWRPRSATETAELFRRAASEGRRLCLRGAGRSYGDAALLAGGDVLDTTAMNRVRSFDAASGRIDVECGVTIEQLWRTALPSGWWPAVVPGTMRPTVGGSIAMNIHGKNHFRAGGFGAHVEEMEVVLPRGDVVRLRPAQDAELFRAVVGGFGMLGAVTSAVLRLHRVHSGLLDVEAVTVPSLAAMVEELDRRADAADYLVGWVDGFEPQGRGVLHQARYLAPGEDPNPATTLRAQDLPDRLMGVVPRGVVTTLLRPFARPGGIRHVNRIKYRAARARGVHRFRQSHVEFAFLLDYVPGWKRIYEPGGLIQYQSFVPREHAARVHTQLLEMCREHGIVPWLGVYKRHRPCDSLMAHALDGFSFAMDFPVTAANRDRLWALCRAMDEVVLAAGGRFYFAKDLTATPSTLERAYPNLARFRELKRELDPQGLLTSDLARRLRV